MDQRNIIPRVIVGEVGGGLTLDKKPIPRETSVEKFADPFYEGCLGSGPAKSEGRAYYVNPAAVTYFGWPALGFSGMGYEYLADVPNDAYARVKAMREKITAWGSKPSAQLDPVIEVSQENIRKFGMHISRLYRDAKAAESLGDDTLIAKLSAEMGLPVGQFLDDYTKMAPLFELSGDSPEFINQMWSNFQPQIISVAKEAAAYIARQFAGSGAEMSKEALDALGSVAGVVPVFGAVAKLMINLYSSWMDAKAASSAAACKYFNETTAEVFKKTARFGLPPPLHILDVYPNAFMCGDEKVGTQAQVNTQILVYDNLIKMIGMKSARIKGRDAIRIVSSEVPALPLPDQDNISWWWNLAQSQMSHPEIEPVFRAMGRDVNGGSFASDEQVMLVAAPIAVAYGINVDEFAEKLWSGCEGWRSRPDLFLPHKYTYNTSGEVGDDILICENPVSNAMQIQLAVLTKCAFNLATELSKYKISASPGFAAEFKPSPTIVKPGLASSSSVAAPVVISGGAALAGFMVAGPAGALIGGGLGWLLGSKF